MTHYEPGGIVPSTAQMQQALGERLRPIQFAAMRVIAGAAEGLVNENSQLFAIAGRIIAI